MELEGKIIDFLGDSITEGVGVKDIENNRYDNVLRRTYKLAATYNYGIGGTRLAHQIKASAKPRIDLCFCGRAYDIDPRADIVVVYGGVNDFLHGDAPIGSREDTTPATYWGGVNFLMTYLPERFKNGTVVFLTPARAGNETFSDETPLRRHMARGDAIPLVGYVDIINEAGKMHGVPVLDLYRNLSINPNIESDRVKYTADGLHLNDAGHAVLAKLLGDFLTSL